MVAWRKRLGFMIEREEDPSSANSVTSQIGPASPAAADKEHPDKVVFGEFSLLFFFANCMKL